MKPWVLKYECATEDGDTEILSFHTSEESAQREACCHIIEVSLPQMSENDKKHQDVAVPFLAHVLNGNFALALQGYQKAITRMSWDESLEIEQVELKSGADTAVMAKARHEMKRWEPRVDEADEGVDEADE